jgi:hypothetical protein
MRPAEINLKKFFLDNACPYLNRHGVSLLYDYRDNSLLAVSKLAQADSTEINPRLSLSSHHPLLSDFIYEFLIADIDDIEEITGDQMLKRFLVGRADLNYFPGASPEDQLSFQWQGRSLIAWDSKKNMHHLPSQLQSVKEIVEFAEHLFQLGFPEKPPDRKLSR